MVPELTPDLRPGGVHDKQRPQPIVPHHHMQKSPPTPSQSLELILVGKDVAATMLCVPVCRSRVMDRNTNSVIVCVPLIVASPVTTVEIPRKADEVEVGNETVVVLRESDEVAAKGEKNVDTVVDFKDETVPDDPVEVGRDEAEDDVVLDDAVIIKDDTVVDNLWEVDGVEVKDKAVPDDPAEVGRDEAEDEVVLDDAVITRDETVVANLWEVDGVEVEDKTSVDDPEETLVLKIVVVEEDLVSDDLREPWELDGIDDEDGKPVDDPWDTYEVEVEDELPGREGGKVGTGTCTGGGHDCHSQTIR